MKTNLFIPVIKLILYQARGIYLQKNRFWLSLAGYDIILQIDIVSKI